MSKELPPWVPRELRRRPQWQIDAMESDPEEAARDSLYQLKEAVEGMYVTEAAQQLDFVGHSELATKLVAVRDLLASTIKEAQAALGDSPYV